MSFFSFLFWVARGSESLIYEVCLSLAQIDKLNVASNLSIRPKREWRSIKRGKYVNVIIPSFIRLHCSNSNEIIYQFPVRKASQRKQFDREFHFFYVMGPIQSSWTKYLVVDSRILMPLCNATELKKKWLFIVFLVINKNIF